MAKRGQGVLAEARERERQNVAATIDKSVSNR